MKRTVLSVILLTVIIFTLAVPCFGAGEDAVARVEQFLAKNGKSGVYSAKLSGGDGTFSMHINGDGDISCSIVQYKNVSDPVNGDYREGFDFTIVVDKSLSGEYRWSCGTEDGNGVTKSKGTMTAADNINTDLVCTDYSGDEYIKRNIIDNAKNFRNDLVRAIANDVNYYLDENLDFFGFNPLFLCPDGHGFGEWVYQKNAKLNVNGTEKRQCTRCFATEEREKAGTMLTPQPSVQPDTPVETPAPAPTPTPETQTPPATTPEQPDSTPTVPDVKPDYKFEQEEEFVEKEKAPLPLYAIVLIIAVAVVAAVGIAVVFVWLSHRAKKPETESDTFEATDEDFE